MTAREWLNESSKSLIGPFVRLPRPEVIEMIALSGFDFAIVDLEHGGMISLSDVYPMILAAERHNIRLIARVPSLDETYFKRLLDMGIGGIQVPHVQDSYDAMLAVDYANFHPLGDRGLCRFVRAAEFSNKPRDRYIWEANLNKLLVLQVEGKNCVHYINEIVKVPGVNVIFIGPYDLSQSLGVPGDIQNPLVCEHIDKVISACKAAGVAVGVFADRPEDARRYSMLGVKYIAYQTDVGIMTTALNTLREDLEV